MKEARPAPATPSGRPVIHPNISNGRQRDVDEDGRDLDRRRHLHVAHGAEGGAHGHQRELQEQGGDEPVQIGDAEGGRRTRRRPAQRQ